MALSIAIIPARKGSKGIVGKNYKEIRGMPLVYWSLVAAYQSSIQTIVLTTDCPKVKKIGKDFQRIFNCRERLHIIDRPKNLCTDKSFTEDAMKHAISCIKKNKSTDYDFVVLLQPTSPARKNNLIDICIDKLINSKADSLLTCSEHTPFFFKRVENGFVKPITDNIRVPRQLLVPSQIYLHDNGNIYVTRYNSFMNYGRLGRKIISHVISDFESMQIDKPEDFIAMEYLANAFGGFL